MEFDGLMAPKYRPRRQAVSLSSNIAAESHPGECALFREAHFPHHAVRSGNFASASGTCAPDRRCASSRIRRSGASSILSISFGCRLIVYIGSSSAGCGKLVSIPFLQKFDAQSSNCAQGIQPSGAMASSGEVHCVVLGEDTPATSFGDTRRQVHLAWPREPCSLLRG